MQTFSMRFFLILLSLTFLAGCGKIANPSQSGKEEEARQAAKKGNPAQAVPLYEAALGEPSRSGDIHYQLALLYENSLNDPVSALHHYRRSNKSHPSHPEAVRAGIKRMESAVKNLFVGKSSPPPSGTVKSSPMARPSSSPTAKPATDKKGFSTHPATARAEQAVGSETRTHRVKKGETLMSISRIYYKRPDRWRDIADANQNQLGNSTELKIDMILIIP